MANILKTDRSAYEPQWTLPTARKEYILYTPQSQIAQLHSNERMIAPIWTKVSRTPWQNSAELCGGYGRKMQVTNWLFYGMFFVDMNIVGHRTTHVLKKILCAQTEQRIDSSFTFLRIRPSPMTHRHILLILIVSRMKTETTRTKSQFWRRAKVDFSPTRTTKFQKHHMYYLVDWAF